MALPNTGLDDSYTNGQPWAAPEANMTAGAIDSQLFNWLRLATAEFPDGCVFPYPDSTSWATSNAGVVSPGAGVVPIVNPGATGAVLLMTAGNLTVSTSTPGWEANAADLRRLTDELYDLDNPFPNIDYRTFAAREGRVDTL